jgi:hypothetical protein
MFCSYLKIGWITVMFKYDNDINAVHLNTGSNEIFHDFHELDIVVLLIH